MTSTPDPVDVGAPAEPATSVAVQSGARSVARRAPITAAATVVTAIASLSQGASWRTRPASSPARLSTWPCSAGSPVGMELQPMAPRGSAPRALMRR